MPLEELDPGWLAIQLLLASLVLPLMLGRAILAYLPAGRVGSHRPADLPATLATSYLVGMAVGHAWGWCLRPLSLGLAGGILADALLIGVLTLQRFLTAPHALVASRTTRRERAGRIQLGLRWICAAAIVARLARVELSSELAEPWSWTFAASSSALVLAAVLIIDNALLDAESRERERSLVWILLTLLLWRASAQTLSSGAFPALLLTTGMASFLVGWWRCADARAGSLVALSSCALALMVPAWWWLGAIGIVVLLAGTPAGGRRIVALATATWFVLLDLPFVASVVLNAPVEASLGLWPPRVPHSISGMPATLAAPLVVLAFGLLLAWGRTERKPA